MEFEKSMSFLTMNAQDRWRFISAAPDPYLALKKECLSLEPGFQFDHARNNTTPSVLLVGAFEPTDLPAGRFNAPPYGLQRLASVLRAAGVNADIYDVTTRGKDHLLKQVQSHQYNVVGFSVLGPTLPNDIQLTHEIKKVSPHSLLLAGGAVPTARPDLLEPSAVDYLIVGYGEAPLLRLLAGQDATKPIKGLYKRFSTGFKGEYAEIPQEEDLRLFTFLLDPTVGIYTDYADLQVSGLYAGMDPGRANTFRFIAQGYCPKGCVFCSTRKLLQNATGEKKVPYISLSSQDRLTVLQNIVKRLPSIQTIFINDDDLFTDRVMARDFFTRVIALKEQGAIAAELRFICSSRIDEIDRDTIQLARRAGVDVINIGIETFSEAGLVELNKGINTHGKSHAEFIQSQLDLIIEAGITPSINLMAFYPGAKWSDVQATVVNAIEAIKKGCEINLTTYVRSYFGADILDDITIPRQTYMEPLITACGEAINVTQETVLLPRDSAMRKYARNVIIRRSTMEEELKKKWGWAHKRAPFQVIKMVFLQALLEEGKTMGFIQNGSVDDMIRELDDLIQIEFGLVVGGQQVSPYVERFPSLSPDLARETIGLEQRLVSAGLSAPVVDLLTKGKVGLFCELWDNGQLSKETKSYLHYLFFGEEKSRFFHLDSLDKYILVQAFMRDLKIEDGESKRVVMTAFGILETDGEGSKTYRKQIQLLSSFPIWNGPDDQLEHSAHIQELMRSILDK